MLDYNAILYYSFYTIYVRFYDVLSRPGRPWYFILFMYDFVLFLYYLYIFIFYAIFYTHFYILRIVETL